MHRARCGKCNKRAVAGQPLRKCRECKGKFCLDDIWGAHYAKDRMKMTDECKYVCDSCKAKYGYVDIDTLNQEEATATMPLKHYMYTITDEFEEKTNMYSFGVKSSRNYVQ